MERVMSVEERIRKAEDIYNRRNGDTSRIATKVEKINKPKKGNVKKLLMQIFVCLSIYVIFYAVTNREYIFSEQFRNEVGLFFYEKINISHWYSSAKEFIASKFNWENQAVNSEAQTADGGENKEDKDKNESNEESVKQENTESEQDVTKKETENQDEKKEESTDENIGGATEETKEGRKDEELSEQELMEKTAKEIKEKISFVEPVKGRISSTFGWRNPTTESVPKYHTGLDIAANEGTIIKSATRGKVIMASSEGDYGNHYQIQIEDIVIVYAHCKKLYLKEGDNVKQGQEIAEVGSTGNSTGPHLHFEIRKGDMKIDPQLIF